MCLYRFSRPPASGKACWRFIFLLGPRVPSVFILSAFKANNKTRQTSRRKPTIVFNYWAVSRKISRTALKEPIRSCVSTQIRPARRNRAEHRETNMLFFCHTFYRTENSGANERIMWNHLVHVINNISVYSLSINSIHQGIAWTYEKLCCGIEVTRTIDVFS